MGPWKKRNKSGFTLTTLVLLALVAAPFVAVAGAQGGDANPGRGSNAAGAANENRGPPENASARAREIWSLRSQILDRFHEAREQTLADYHAELAAIRESYLENKTLAIEECRAAHESDDDGNETAENDALGHCIRDGLQPLKDGARAGMRETRENAKVALRAAVQSFVDEWREGRAVIHARHGA